ncbi:MAG: EF-P lysine aminoacylase EpmA [Candidatus Marinimicrobia bacterium]|nr:EF-P lysine aminoacylase EpmA [Candidatus Neomarinimicrobiota bacterium]
MNRHRIEQKRALINLIRTWFMEQGFFELETPLLVPSPGIEVHLHGFKTSYLDHGNEIQEYYLPTSPEFAIKKALGNGFEKVFEIARVFRNHGELGPQHHPEFNMLEWYRPGNYQDIMDDVDALLHTLSEDFKSIDTPPGFSWDQSIQRTSVSDCFHKYADLDLEQGLRNQRYWLRAARQVLNESIPENEPFEDIFFRVWMKLIESKLGISQPEIVYDYPASMAALSKIKASDPQWAERFELYIQGVEIGNAFSELINSKEQIKRFKDANLERKILGYPPHPVDEDLIKAVGKMKPTGGIAIGIERLLMVLTGESDIRQFFLQPLGGSGGATKRR